MRPLNIIIAAFCLALPSPSLARAVPAATNSAAGVHQAPAKDGNPRLGLLGLLGLIGLMGFIRREPNIHIDARRGARPKVSAGSSARS